jgi:hypothetical protein
LPDHGAGFATWTLSVAACESTGGNRKKTETGKQECFMLSLLNNRAAKMQLLPVPNNTAGAGPNIPASAPT